MRGVDENWQLSSWAAGAGNLEVRLVDGRVQLRADGLQIDLSEPAWQFFVAGVKNDEFDI